MRVALVGHGLPYRVEATADLAILQFAKFRLWKDLDEHWADFAENPLVRHLVHQPTEAFADPARDTGDFVDLDELAAQLPAPADASQLRAIAEAVAGRTFVLEGPPGTGKSQTITNLLTRAVADGQAGAVRRREAGGPRRRRAPARRGRHGHVRPRPARQGLARRRWCGRRSGWRSSTRSPSTSRAWPPTSEDLPLGPPHARPLRRPAARRRTPPGSRSTRRAPPSWPPARDVEPLPVPAAVRRQRPGRRADARCGARWRCCPTSPT